jgi:hypothetical protein
VIVETRTFRLAPGVSEEDFLAADRSAQLAAYSMAGIVRRTTCYSDDGTWLVVTVWADADSAGDVPGLDGLVESVEARCFTTLD